MIASDIKPKCFDQILVSLESIRMLWRFAQDHFTAIVTATATATRSIRNF